MYSVIHGDASAENIISLGRGARQIYGLAGNDTIETNESSVIVSGGAGDDVIKLVGGNATLNGGSGADVFVFDCSSGARLNAVIEDIDPDNDRLRVINGGNPKLSHALDGSNAILTDSEGALNVTLKGTRRLDEYYDQNGSDRIWEVLEIVNEERENVGAQPLTLERDLMNGAAIRAPELIELFSHTRPDGTACYTALEHGDGYVGENAAAGRTTAEEVMDGWMNSSGHRANILNANYTRLGVGHTYEEDSTYGHYWIQMFRGYDNGEMLDTEEMLSTQIELTDGKVSVWSELASADELDLSGALPNGMTKSGETISVESNYEGGVWLTGFDILNWTERYADSTALEINASSDTQTDRVIVGNERSNVIRAGRNGAWMWGRLGDDTLVGGSGADMFWFGANEGSCEIENCGVDDVVNLWSIDINDIVSFESDGGNVSADFRDGSSLDVKMSGASTTFQLSNGTRWNYERSSRSFSYVDS